MDKSDTSELIRFSDVPAAIGLLTRLPVKVDESLAMERGAKAAWAYPIAGLVIAALAGAVGQVGLWLGLPSEVIAVLVLLALIFPTGALHEDGLADSVDGLWGGWTKERRLEIMKDSRIGAYGVIALVISLMLRGVALNALIGLGLLWPAVFIAAAMSRASMVTLMCWLPNARESGLSQMVGRPDKTTTALSALIAALVALVMSPYAFMWLVICASLSAYACGALARRKIGGQTGDILGGTGQVVEIIALLVLVAVAS